MVRAAGTGALKAAAEAVRKAAQEAARKAAEEAARKAAEEAARKAAEEAARKAAQEAARKAAQEAARKAAADKKVTPRAEQRKENYQAAKTRPLSAESARLQGVTAKDGGAAEAKGKEKVEAVSKTPRLDAAKAKAADMVKGMEGRVAQAKERFSSASVEAKNKVDGIASKARDASGQIFDAADKGTDKLFAKATALAADKLSPDQKKILAEADKRASSIMERATGEAGKFLSKAADSAEKVLKGDVDVKGFLGKAMSKAGDFLDTVTDPKKLAESVKDVSQNAAEQVEDFTKWVGDQAFKVVDNQLDRSPLGEDAVYTQEKTGALGDLVTNRLEVGESAFISLDADATINGVKVSAGTELEVKRVPATDKQGNPRLEPLDEHGGRPTDLEVSFVGTASAGVGVSVGAGMGGSIQKGPESLAGNDINLGGQAGVNASAEAGFQGELELTFTFDPNSQEDMDHLTGFLGAAAKSSIPVVGALNARNAAEAAADFGGHMTKVRGELGVHASAQASASVSLGNIDEGAHGAGAEVKAKGKQLAAIGNKVKGEEPEATEETEEKHGLKGAATAFALDKVGIDLGGLRAGVNGEVNVGSEYDLRKGETTLYLNVKGNAKASASALDLTKSASAEYDRTIAVKLDKEGEVKKIDVIEEMSSSKFQGIGDEDVRGRVNSRFLAQVEQTDTVTITRSYTPAALAEFKQQAGDDKAAAMRNLAQNVTNPESNPKLQVTDIKATRTDAVNTGFDVAGTGIKLGMGRRIEKDVDNTNDLQGTANKVQEHSFAVGQR